MWITLHWDKLRCKQLTKWGSHCWKSNSPSATQEILPHFIKTGNSTQFLQQPNNELWATQCQRTQQHFILLMLRLILFLYLLLGFLKFLSFKFYDEVVYAFDCCPCMLHVSFHHDGFNHGNSVWRGVKFVTESSEVLTQRAAPHSRTPAVLTNQQFILQIRLFET
jgi:hypothetical protein